MKIIQTHNFRLAANPWETPLEEYQKQPLVRTVGEDFGGDFYHGTQKKYRKHLTSPAQPPHTEKKRKFTGNPMRDMFSGGLNEFGAEMFLAEPRQAVQATMFARGKNNGMFVISLKPGSKILDLSDECARRPVVTWGMGKADKILKFFRRPAITDDFINWYLSHVSDNYKERCEKAGLDWKQKIKSYFDPSSPDFSIELSWKPHLVKYAKEKGYDAIRFADETLLLNREALAKARPATFSEVKGALRNPRTYPAESRGGLYTDTPTNAYEESQKYHVEKALREGKNVPPEIRQRYGL